MGLPNKLFAELKDFLDDKGIKYHVIDEADNLMVLAFAGRSSKGGGIDTRVAIDFDESVNAHDAVSVHFVSYSMAKCQDDDAAKAIVRINALNKRFRWVKFWFDDSDNTINADADALIFEGRVGEECAQFAFRMSDIIEDALLDVKDIFNIDGGEDGGPSREEVMKMLELLRGLLDEQ